MKLNYFCLLLGIMFLSVGEIFSQGEVDSSYKIMYRNEKGVGLFLNSNGFGINYRKAKSLDGYRKSFLEFDFNYVSHPREIRMIDPYLPNASRYVYGKVNVFVNFRAVFGRQKEIYSKFDKNSIAIRYFYAGGVVAGILKPIYYEVFRPNGNIIEKFDSQKHRSGDIVGKASFFEGISETTLTPGATIKGGFIFDFSTQDTKIRNLEVGAVLDVYPRVMKIMESDDNQWALLSLFVCYRFGRIYSTVAADKSKDLEKNE